MNTMKKKSEKKNEACYDLKRQHLKRERKKEEWIQKENRIMSLKDKKRDKKTKIRIEVKRKRKWQ